jgi:hypothetical protein
MSRRLQTGQESHNFSVLQPTIIVYTLWNESSRTPDRAQWCLCLRGRPLFHSPSVNIPATNQSPWRPCPAQELEYKTSPPRTKFWPPPEAASDMSYSFSPFDPSSHCNFLFFTYRLSVRPPPHTFPILTYVTWEIGQETLCTKKDISEDVEGGKMK